MGLSKSVPFNGPPPAWDALAARLSAAGLVPSLRMIDGELAFPDETPPPLWTELRLALPGGMVTVRKTPDGADVVVWGNADAELLKTRDLVAETLMAQLSASLPTT